MKTYTLADIRVLGPCYNPACYELIRYLPEAWSGTVVDVLDCTDCPAKDRIWVAVRLLPSEQAVKFAQDCAAVARGYADKARGTTRTMWAAARAADWVARTVARADWAQESADWAARAAERAGAAWEVAARATYAARAAERAQESADWAAVTVGTYTAVAAADLAARNMAAARAAERAERDRQIEALKRLAKEVV